MSSSSGKTIKLIVFDFDRTLIDLNANWPRVRQRVAKACGVPEVLDKDVSLFDVMDAKPEVAEGVFAIIKEEEMLALQTASLMPEAKEFMEWAKTRHIFIAIVSNNHHDVIVKAFQKFNLPKPAMIMGSDDVTMRKPNPEGLEKIMRELKVSNQECILIGDSLTDEKLGRACEVVTYILSPTLSFETIKEHING